MHLQQQLDAQKLSDMSSSTLPVVLSFYNTAEEVGEWAKALSIFILGHTFARTQLRLVW